MEGESVEHMRPSLAFLNYRKFFFWIGLFAIDIVLFVLWGIFSYWWPIAGLLTAPLWLFLIVVPDVVIEESLPTVANVSDSTEACDMRGSTNAI